MNGVQAEDVDEDADAYLFIYIYEYMCIYVWILHLKGKLQEKCQKHF